MNKSIDYYFAPQSPWAYLGHARFAVMAAAAQASVRVLPADFGRIFAATGGLPLPKRAPVRQAYRLIELARFRDLLKLPMNLEPRYFPVAADDAARLIIAVDRDDGSAAAMRLSAAVYGAVWVQQRNIADAQTLVELLQECGLPQERQLQSREPLVQSQFDANTERAIAAGVFGTPSYCLDGEIFWGQDRLEFLGRKLQSVIKSVGVS
ncbi:MAG: 2-hydroxychromene-2-carboxylate isomerase [Comamonadaceae bacterium]